jgi:hypothetical protein
MSHCGIAKLWTEEIWRSGNRGTFKFSSSSTICPARAFKQYCVMNGALLLSGISEATAVSFGRSLTHPNLRDADDEIGRLCGNCWFNLWTASQGHHRLVVGVILSWFDILLLTRTWGSLSLFGEEFHEYLATESECCAISWRNMHSDFISPLSLVLFSSLEMRMRDKCKKLWLPISVPVLLFHADTLFSAQLENWNEI